VNCGIDRLAIDLQTVIALTGAHAAAILMIECRFIQAKVLSAYGA
jgi:hypothetical protein